MAAPLNFSRKTPGVTLAAECHAGKYLRRRFSASRGLDISSGCWLHGARHYLKRKAYAEEAKQSQAQLHGEQAKIAVGANVIISGQIPATDRQRENNSHSIGLCSAAGISA
jgi:hypothetical protein